MSPLLTPARPSFAWGGTSEWCHLCQKEKFSTRFASDESEGLFVKRFFKGLARLARSLRGLRSMPLDSKECLRHAAHCRWLASRHQLYLPGEIFIGLAERWESLAAERRLLSTPTQDKEKNLMQGFPL